MSFVALIGAGLFLRSLDQARAIDPGFDAEQLAVLSFNLTTQGMPLEAASERQRQIVERVRGVAGVERAAYASTTPLAGGGFARSVFLEGQDVTDPRAARLVQVEQHRRGIPRDPRAFRCCAAAAFRCRRHGAGAASRDHQRDDGAAVLAQ